MGLSVPAYFNSDAGTQLLEQIGSMTLLGESFATGLRDVVAAIGKTGMAVAAIIGLILDNTVPATAEERGLDA